ncbi:cation:proton antiporter [Gemmata sp. JC717]|uniref:cation:proton antiporter domain-containing protein n=1 Tax=Gemmata algarum TaxID=2975278 RepID=UPI0021BA6667|nr:cation:proton antiporter [Gemmata algarum]MDY3555893.1 cation:proton antiporter [Gemmata algarum]
MHEFPLITTLAAAFTAAWVLGLLTQWMRLSPIVGYLLAGVLIGPHTPGFQGDVNLAHQLAEVGVILLMFGVGLHFHLEDLLAVRAVALPGALGQSLAATAASVAVFALLGVDVRTGLVIGMALAVASTVVLMRVLMDADALNSPAGHVAVGWLLVEDVLTVIVLVMIPVLGGQSGSGQDAGGWAGPLIAIGLALLKLAVLVAVVMVAGSRLVPWALTQVARLRSRELFTLTVMVFSVAIAAGAYALFGASMALGAFLAGMMVARSPVSHQAAADALPLRDAFAVLFFVSVGMLFDPALLLRAPLMMLAALFVILLVKPLIALVIVAALGHSVRTALTVALGLAQIGEFSFILSDLARKHGLMTDDGHSLLVGAAIISITINPVLFRSIDSVERWLQRRPRLWARLNARAERRVGSANAAVADDVARGTAGGDRRAVVVGFGPVGKTVDRLLRDAGLTTVVIDTNMDTVAELRRQGQTAVFGDAAREAILESAGVAQASHLVLTLPHSADRAGVVAVARNLNPRMKIFVRAHYLRERGDLEQVGATAAIFEEAEAAVSLARLVLADAGAGRDSIEKAVRDVRTRLILDNVSALRGQPVRNIMVPWTRVRRLSKAATLDEVRRQVGEQRFSRWPVVAPETGLPVGYLLAKDLIGLTADGAAWATLIRPLGAVRPDDDVESTLLYFQREGTTVCVVTDGESPVGIVTVEDLLEQVVGRIEDEYPRHPAVSLRDLLVTDAGLLAVPGRTAEQAITAMAARIPARLLPPGADIAALAIAREHELPTSLGLGVAVPHARCPNLAEPLVMFGRSTEGVVFDPRSSELVHLMFLLVTPAERPNLQVLLLGQVARAAGNSETRNRLRAAESPAEVAEILATEPVGAAGPKTGS